MFDAVQPAAFGLVLCFYIRALSDGRLRQVS